LRASNNTVFRFAMTARPLLDLPQRAEIQDRSLKLRVDRSEFLRERQDGANAAIGSALPARFL
jgi:hypothetical protein